MIEINERIHGNWKKLKGIKVELNSELVIF